MVLTILVCVVILGIGACFYILFYNLKEIYKPDKNNPRLVSSIMQSSFEELNDRIKLAELKDLDELTDDVLDFHSHYKSRVDSGEYFSTLMNAIHARHVKLSSGKGRSGLGVRQLYS
jgi:hypothetical protein